MADGKPIEEANAFPEKRKLDLLDSNEKTLENKNEGEEEEKSDFNEKQKLEIPPMKMEIPTLIAFPEKRKLDLPDSNEKTLENKNEGEEEEKSDFNKKQKLEIPPMKMEIPPLIAVPWMSPVSEESKVICSAADGEGNVDLKVGQGNNEIGHSMDEGNVVTEPFTPHEKKK
ncbi:hypothetical protein ACJIZ3_015200 [Penstemon smallii]|uniref:Uncharacterized protein n=1 Tax=Penstemon smallii TaxID=265156 RepID=A0ABD3RLT6_9LAMI